MPSNGSTAPWVEWKTSDVRVRGPVVIVVDRPGGPMDLLAGDPDVTTFFNDRFHPMFLQESEHQPTGTVRFYDGCGCPLTNTERPTSPEALIAIANDVIVRPDARRCEGTPFSYTCAR